MDLPHEWYVAMAKSFGLFWLVAMSIVITLYAFWPSLGGRFRRAADSILEAIDAGVDMFVIRGTTVSAEHVSSTAEPLNDDRRDHPQETSQRVRHPRDVRILPRSRDFH